MVGYFISWFSKGLLFRLCITGMVVSIPVGFTTGWLGSAYLSLMIGADFWKTLSGLMIFGWPGAFIPGVALSYGIERWLIRNKACTSLLWVGVRILSYMLLGIPEGYGTLFAVRAGMQEFPPIVESIYFVQTTTVAFVLGILYTVIERVILEIQKRENKLKGRIEELRIEIDQLKKQKQVEEITGSEFFQDLKMKAMRMRARAGETT